MNSLILLPGYHTQWHRRQGVGPVLLCSCPNIHTFISYILLLCFAIFFFQIFSSFGFLLLKLTKITSSWGYLDHLWWENPPSVQIIRSQKTHRKYGSFLLVVTYIKTKEKGFCFCLFALMITDKFLYPAAEEFLPGYNSLLLQETGDSHC